MTWLSEVLDPNTPAFALLHRPDSGGVVELLVGDMVSVPTLADVPVPPARPATGPSCDVLALVPYRQIAERGFDCIDDETPLTALQVRKRSTLLVSDVQAATPSVATALRDADFTTTDDEYANIVRAVVATEIGTGEGANFVIKRSFRATIANFAESPREHAFAIFARLLSAEVGAHWTFLIHTGTRTLIGASPERHITVADGVATMNPISGTFRYPQGRFELPRLRRFLADNKETDELFMVLDEELKMMARVCHDGGRVIGPQIRPMARLAHTEYFIEGHTDLDVRDILRETMFAPTVTGSPLESACRVIARHERDGRGYYAGVLALIGRDEAGGQTMDSVIAIRTADIDVSGDVRVDVGATLVRHSDPSAEAAETRAKSDALLEAFSDTGKPSPASEWRDSSRWQLPMLVRTIQQRNDLLANFWLQPQRERPQAVDALAGRRALVIDCEDHFTAMLRLQLSALGLDVRVQQFDDARPTDDYDLIVMGPGPGDPNAVTDRRIVAVRKIIRGLLEEGRPMLAVCLSHQILARQLGLELRRLPRPHQGEQRSVEVFGRREHCGFYNTYAAFSPVESVEVPEYGGTVLLDRDPVTGMVHGMRGTTFRSIQFHAESVLTRRGVDLLALMAGDLLSDASSNGGVDSQAVQARSAFVG